MGKTHVATELGRQHFEIVATADFERSPALSRVFEQDLAPRRIVAELEILLNRPIEPGRTLLFLDEIQACPRALMALRYFHEELPELHVIAAGSLLEFALSDSSFPVGRIEFLRVAPLCFAEFLQAGGQHKAQEIVTSTPVAVGEATHEFLLQQLRSYLFVGGMPEAVSSFMEAGSLARAFNIHEQLLLAYRADFAKYETRMDPQCLDSVLAGIARSLGQTLVYSRLAEGWSQSTKKRAFDALSRALLVSRIPATSAAGVPLAAAASARRFKALFLDVGLWQSLSGMRADLEYARPKLLDLYRGAMAEQFVGQELNAGSNRSLHCWMRTARNSSAEVDYLIEVDGEPLPIEVKSGPAGRLRSLHLLLKEFPNCRRGVVLSTAPFARLDEQRILFVPIYFAGSLHRLET